MNQICGCCAGIEVVTPQPEANRPGLTALAYRAGTYATFFESMVARLSNLYLDVTSPDGTGPIQRIYPLRNLTTREASDPSIALLDVWAIVADVLTFYQQRIANEGYLLTATERLSILELARLVGYKLRPGVSASVYLAFTVANGFNGTIPAGTRSQSIPGTGETTQFFETSADLAARDTWNNLAPRLTRPQVITLASDPGTDAATRGTLYFEGISTNLKAGDPLIIVLGNTPALVTSQSSPNARQQQVLRFVATVNPQPDEGRTEVTLRMPTPRLSGTVQEIIAEAAQPFIDEATSIFFGSDLASQVATILQVLLSKIQPDTTPETAANLVGATVPQVQQVQDVAVKREFTRVTAWTADVLDVLNFLAQLLPTSGAKAGGNKPPPAPTPAQQLAPSALANLVAILDPLAQPPSLQPANSFQLPRTIGQTFSPQADTAPRLLARFNPAVTPTIYQAWAGVETPSLQVQVSAFRGKAGLFASNSMGLPQYNNNQLTGYERISIAASWGGLVPSSDGVPAGAPSAVALDAAYDHVRVGTWVAIDRPEVDSQTLLATGNRILSFHRVMDLKTITMAAISTEGLATGYSAKSTQLILNPTWLSDLASTSDQISAVKSEDLLRGTIVYAQAENLAFADEPLDTDVEGNTIELAQLYNGLESGRWIIVSGERTDIPNTTGVTASELVMVSGVAQGSQAPLCATFPPNYIPFTKVYYTTDANRQGDRLVVGELAGGKGGLDKLSKLMPKVTVFNQQFCDQIQLAPGVYVKAYVPTDTELKGAFPDFEGLLVDPTTHIPYAGGVIRGDLGQVFAWRISSAEVHTILTLANPLAYTYSSTAVTVYGNVANATHGQTVGEVLGDGDGSQSFQNFALHQMPLTYVAAATPEGAQSTLVVSVNEIEWQEGSDLAELGPTDHEYITQTDNSDQTTVVFGDGAHGARVPTGSANIKAVYRYGIGAAGNVQAGQISQLATHPQGAQGVINPLPANGGADHDSSDQARRNTPLAVMALDRLVSVQDYADFARTFAGIGKAYSARLTDGRRQLVHVTIAGAEDIPIDQNSDLYLNLVQALHQYGDPYLPIQVAVRKLKLLVISGRVEVLPDYQWESVEPDVRAALLDAFGFDQRDLGQSAFLSEAISIIQGVAGVSYVDLQIFDAVPENITAAQLAGLASTLALNNFVEADLARVDPNVTYPANRIVPAELVIVTPDIPDTLILTEITG